MAIRFVALADVGFLQILELLENISLRRNMSQQCREVAVEEYSLDLYAQRFIDLYSQVLSDVSDIKQKAIVKT